MPFLQKLGSIILKATQIAVGVSPILGAIRPDLADEAALAIGTMQQLSGIIVTAEAFGQTLNIPGPDKLRAATPLIAEMINRSSIMVGRKIQNPALFSKGCAQLGAGMADILNSLDDHIDTANKA